MSNTVSLKLSDLVTQFDGSGDFCEWLQKFELVARIQKISDLEDYIPLFLSGGAFAVYQGLSDADKGSYASVKRSLTAAFTVGPFKAYEELMIRRLLVGESVDVFLADITRLATLVAGAPDENWLKCAFVHGLPDVIKAQLQASCSLSSMSMSELVEKARSLVGSKELCFTAICKARNFRGDFERRRGSKNRGGTSITCYSCGEVGHMSNSCPQRANGGGPRTSGDRFCFVCGKHDHLASSCDQRKTEPAKNA
jgi:hypothetical protein